MNRALPSLLALLLVFSSAVVPGMAAARTSAGAPTELSVQNQVSTVDPNSSELRTVSNTTNRLSLDGDSRSDYLQYGPDLGATVASTDSELRIDHIQYTTLDRQFEDATTEERRAILQTTYDRLKERSDALRTREEQAVRDHAAGELSSTQLLQTLLRNHREAAALSEAFGDLEERSDRVSETSLPVEDQQDKLEMHRTPIRSQLESDAYGYRGSGGERYFSIETSQNGYIIGSLGESYIREATRFDNRDTSQPTQFEDILNAYDHSRQLYPWAYETVQSPSFNEYTTVQLYRIDNSHDQGHLVAYLDGGTGDIYREIQVLDQNSLPDSENGKVAVTNGIQLSITGTKGNGPAIVTATDSETGDPQSATITIDGSEVGTTGDDGSLWYVPPSDEYELRAETAAGNSASVTLSPS